MKVYLSLLQVVSVQAVELLCLPGFVHGLVEGVSQIHELGAVLGQPVLDAAQQVLVGLPAGVQLALHSMQHCTGGTTLANSSSSVKHFLCLAASKPGSGLGRYQGQK